MPQACVPGSGARAWLALAIGVCVIGCHRGDQAPDITPAPTAASEPKAATAEPPAPAPEVDGSTCASVDACAQILASSRDRDALTAAGVWLASRGEPAAVAALGEHLREAEFLARLDDVDSPGDRTRNLARILAAFAHAPIEDVAALCRELARDPDWATDGDRMTHLLHAAAAPKPMTAETVALFEQTNAQDFAPANALVLAHNASPNALALLEKMLTDATFEIDDRVYVIHRGLLPVRTEESIVQLVSRMLARKLPTPVEVALVETMFDHRSAEWFGKERTPPEPPPWSAASAAALELALNLGKRVRGRASLPSALRARIDETVAEMQTALAAK